MDDTNRKTSPFPYLLLIMVLALVLYIVNNKTGLISNLFSARQIIDIQKQTAPIETPSLAPSTIPSPNVQPGQFQMSQKNIGETFVINGIEFKVLSAKNLGSNLSAYGNAYQKTSGKYIEARISAKNIGTTNTTLDNILFALQDSLSRQYTTDLISMFFVNVTGYKLINSFNNSYGMSVIKPGFSENYIFITDVAKDSTGIKLIVANQKDQNYFIPLGF